MGLENTLGVSCAAVLILTGGPAVAKPEPQVEIRVFQFRPGRLEIKAGTTVAWTNQDNITHTVTSGTPQARNGHFGQRLEGKGTTTTVEFSEPGVYPYFCERHPSMRGELRVDYTVGVATKDHAKQQQAVDNLVAYTQDFGAFLESANPNLPKAVVADLVKHHVVTLKAVIDAQASRDHARAYAAQRAATAHMKMIADPLAEAIVKQFPDRFTASAQ